MQHKLKSAQKTFVVLLEKVFGLQGWILAEDRRVSHSLASASPTQSCPNQAGEDCPEGRKESICQ